MVTFSSNKSPWIHPNKISGCPEQLGKQQRRWAYINAPWVMRHCLHARTCIHWKPRLAVMPIFSHWWQLGLSLWRSAVPPVTTTLVSWQLLFFNVTFVVYLPRIRHMHDFTLCYPSPVLAFGYCRYLRLYVSLFVCVYQLRACPRDNSSNVQARITKFGPLQGC